LRKKERGVDRDSDDDRNRQDMLTALRTRVDELVKKTINQGGEIALGFVEVPDALIRLEELSRVPEGVPTAIPADAPILSVFDRFGQHLLILGAPGAGKTTLLRKLARALVERAEKDEHERIPVILELSTWANERRPLTDWMVERLQQSYRVPQKLAEDWVKRNQILPLLDGLDEVPSVCRGACVDAINQFRQMNGLVPVAVCCRVKDYDSIGQKLELDGAVAIRQLARADVEDYLQRLGQPLEGVRQVLARDQIVWDLLDTPLMVDILIRSYQGLPAESLALPGNIDEQRRHLFRAYVDRMFQHRRGSSYPRARVEWWLMGLAQQLVGHHEKDFYLEDLQASWRSQQTRRYLSWVVRLVGGLSATLVSGLVSGLIGALFAALVGGLSSALIGGFFGAVVGALVSGLVLALSGSELIEPVETMYWSWKRALEGDALQVGGFRGGLVGALVGGLIGGLLGALVGLITVVVSAIGHSADFQPHDTLIVVLSIALVSALAGALFLAVVGGMAGALLSLVTVGLVPGKVEQKLVPNQAIWASLRIGLICVLIGVSGMLGGGVIVMLLGKVWLASIAAPLWLGAMLFVGLNRGISAFIRHFILRGQLAVDGFAPFRYVPFLEYATALLLLERNGGAYRFRHDLLQEYFASLT
jgi:hypothetical protein